MYNVYSMSYEQEQTEYREQLEKINSRISELERAFMQNPSLRISSNGGFYGNTQEEYLKLILQKHYGDFNTSGDSVYMLEYKLCKHKKKELEYKLKESKTDRNIIKTLDFIDGITPRHVSGRVYEVKDGDGCGTFCLWFLVVDAIIVFLYYIISGRS